jgi:CRISPR-associated protein Cmr5
MMAESSSIQQTREQKRAAQAWQDVQNVPQNLGEQYGTQARKLAALIQINGLGQTLAFLKAKASDNAAMDRLYGHVSNWVTSQMGEGGDLLQAVTRWSSGKYRRATVEALAYAIWLRRFAEAHGWGERGEET